MSTRKHRTSTHFVSVLFGDSLTFSGKFGGFELLLPSESSWTTIVAGGTGFEMGRRPIDSFLAGVRPSLTQPLGLTSLGASSMRRIMSGLSLGITPPGPACPLRGEFGSGTTFSPLPEMNARNRRGHGLCCSTACSTSWPTFFASDALRISSNFCAKKRLKLAVRPRYAEAIIMTSYRRIYTMTHEMMTLRRKSAR